MHGYWHAWIEIWMNIDNHERWSMIMMNEGFISPSINVEDAVEEIGDINLVTKENNENINSFMSNSFGFGGTNACLIFSKD